MTPQTSPDNLFAALERLFHEPARLGLMSLLCAEADGVSFNDLKRELALTDGNLSRHLKTLDEAGVVRIDKSTVGAKPRTTVHVTPAGRRQFVDYLKTLEAVLQQAADAVGTQPRKSPNRTPDFGKPAKA
jgi:DNA-binding MarR family transcriptional regulator